MLSDLELLLTKEESRDFGSLDLFQANEEQLFDFEFDDDKPKSLDRYKSELKSLPNSTKHHNIALMIDFKFINLGVIEIDTERIIWTTDDICYEFIINQLVNTAYKQVGEDELVVLTLEGGKSVQFKFNTKAAAADFNDSLIDKSTLTNHFVPKTKNKKGNQSELTLPIILPRIHPSVTVASHINNSEKKLSVAKSIRDHKIAEAEDEYKRTVDLLNQEFKNALDLEHNISLEDKVCTLCYDSTAEKGTFELRSNLSLHA